MKKRFLSLRPAGRVFCVIVLLLGIVFSLGACSLLFGGNNGNSTSTNNGTTSNNTKSSTFEVALYDETGKVTSIGGVTAGDFIEEVEKNKIYKIKKPTATPTKEGYNFLQWCSDKECTKELAYGDVISSDLKIYAKWSIKVFFVTLMDELDVQDELEVTYNTKVTLPTRESAGYTFLGWYTDTARTKEFDKDTLIKENTTLYAKWEEIQYPLHYFTDGGELSDGYPESYTMTADVVLPVCTKAGYEFVGWYDNEQKEGINYTSVAKGQQGEKSFYAKYICTLAEVRSTKGNVVVTENAISISVKYREIKPFELEDFLSFSDGAEVKIYREKDGKWNDEIIHIDIEENTGETEIVYNYKLRVKSEKVVSENGSEYREFDLTITQYTSKNLTVTYYYSESDTVTDESKIIGDEAYEPDDPEPAEGYLFDYWVIGSLEGARYDFSTELVTSISLYAKYKTIDYTVSYVLGYGENDEANPPTYTIEDAVTLEDALPSNEEYSFEGWYDESYENKITSIALGSMGDITLYARYTLKNKIVKDYSEQTVIPLSELGDYLVYVFYNRIETVAITITGGTPGTDLEEILNDATSYASFVDGSDGRNAIYYHVKADDDGVWDLTTSYNITFEYREAQSKESKTSDYAQVRAYGLHFSETGRPEDYDDFAIEHVADTLVVEDTEQLVFAVEHGYRPLPVEGSAAETVYEKAKTVLRTYLDDEMNDFQKALAIYEYIATYVSYDHDVFDKVKNNTITNTEAAEYYCFYLEGVFNGHIAVCDGYSKAFMLLCRMEGIRAYQVEGTAVRGGTGHAWNKIEIAVGEGEREWYVVDCTSADTLTRFSETESKEVFTHAYFLYDDVLMNTRYTTAEDEEARVFEAEQNGDYYGAVTFSWEDSDYDLKISSDAEMVVFLKYLIACAQEANTQISIDISISNDYIGADDSHDPFTYVYDEEEEKYKVSGIRQDIVNSVGSIINSYSVTWVSADSFNSYTFLCKERAK